jgi:two-component system response regulator AtoC
MQIERVLVVDDELLMREFLNETLRRAGCEVSLAANGDEACRLLGQDTFFDLVLTDIKMDGRDGLEVLECARQTAPQTLVALMTAHASLDSAIEAMHKGAFDYLTKPISANQLDVLLAKAAQYRSLVEENRFYRHDAANSQDGFEDLVGRSPSIQEVLKLIAKVAPSTATVLVTGESGTGKELIARAIHRRSNRADKPFIRVNCAALPETLLESELFGHERGAFTGAVERRAGRFELAHTGTLLLDEISETSLALQSKLLRVLQEREFERVGGTKTLQVDVRVICTSNRDLKKAVRDGKFREDLFYRLNVVPIDLPALREREGDVLLLAEYFLRRYSERHHRPLAKLSEDGRLALCSHEWPGNVRELENLIERAVLLGESPMMGAEVLGLSRSAPGLAAAPAQAAGGMTGVPAEEDINQLTSLAEIEKRVILRTMRLSKGNRTQAARKLGISVRTLYTKLREYETEQPQDEARQETLAEVS